MKLAQNFLSLAGAEVISKIVTFAAFAFLARVAGPDGFGYLEFAGETLFCAWLLVEQGFGSYGAREIAKAPQRTPELVVEIALVRLLFAVIAYAAMIAFALLSDHTLIVTRLLLIYGASLLFGPLLLQWVFQGHDRMWVVAAAQVIRQTVFAATVFIFVREAGRIWLAAVAEVAGVASAAIYVVWMYQRQFGVKRMRLGVAPRLFCEAAVIGLSQMFWVSSRRPKRSDISPARCEFWSRFTRSSGSTASTCCLRCRGRGGRIAKASSRSSTARRASWRIWRRPRVWPGWRL